jgi:hypothetical protein
MTQIHKFSLVYDVAEDRLAWDAEDTDGATTRLWLTQRLSRGLVSALLPLLQAATAQKIAPQHEASVQSWEQAAAMAEFGKVPGVKPQAEATTGLVRAVHIRPSNTGMDLTFEFGADGSRTVSIAHAAVRQTLAVMHRLYVAAEWPLDVWPAWISQPAAPASAEALN